MAKSTRQKEAALLWRQEQFEAECVEKSQSIAMYIPKYLSDVGNLGNEEANKKLNQIRKLSEELRDILYNEKYKN